ncbi:MAG TPA: S41 family peptidase [Bryobacteraceae bacterium]|nr:S41 family peptidase [Bryobacteraceae bacterium]
MALDAKQRAGILKSIRKLVLAHHINVAGIDYRIWAEQVDARTPELLNCDLPTFEAGVRQLLGELKTSHTVFYHSLPKEMLPQHTINASLRDIALDGERKWMFLDVFEAGPANLAGIRPGDILEGVDGTTATPPATPYFGIGQRHTLRVRRGCEREIAEVIIDVPLRKGTKQRPPIVEPKSPIHSVISPKIGSLKIPYFPGAMGMRFAAALDRAIDDMKREGCDRLIIDLRGNIGGSLGFARLASYMCPGKIPIGHSLTPKRLRTGYDPASLPRVPMPRSRAELLITLGLFAFRDKSVMLLTQGLGPQPFHGRIVLLVNEWTNSAAEMLANFAAENRLATLIGQKTRGNVLGAANFKVGGGYWLRIPVFGWFTSRGISIEGKGVSPDRFVDITQDALAAGHDQQIDDAIENLSG